MKKIISFLFAILLMFSLVSCGEQSDFIDLTNGNKKTKQTTEKEDNYYTINFYTNGGTKIDPINIKENEHLNYFPETEKQGYILEGWYTDSNLNNPILLPIHVNSNLNLYAKWLLVYEERNLTGSIIEKWNDNGKIIYGLKPEELDLIKLKDLNYALEIKLTYSICYEQTYEAPLDIGYFGAPKYETYFRNAKNILESETDKEATLSKRYYSVTYKENLSTLKSESFEFEISSDNIQNRILINDMKVTFRCIK